MDAESLQRDVREGRLDPERLIDIILRQQRQLAEAKRKIKELEQSGQRTKQSGAPFSLQAEEKRQQGRGKKRFQPGPAKRRGRIHLAKKLAQAERTEKVFPAGVPQSDCHLSHTRLAWRLENGHAARVAYEIYRGPKNQYGKISGVLGRSEFGWEIVLALAFQIYIVGLSFDKACLLLGFFQNLTLRKSQAEAIVKQLAKHWEREFDHLCTLLAHSAVVHADETSWSLHSVWAILSEQARVLLFGVHKDAATLAKLLDPATFAGLMISDDAAVYSNFTHAQKCWAHLLRKAIKLTLLDPTKEMYRDFTDRLLEIYHAACRLQCDKRFSAAGRAAKVMELDDRLLELCGATWSAELPKLEGTDDDFRLLCNELMRLMLAEELFTFVNAAPITQPNGITQPVAGTNNEAERTLRGPALARKTGRTNKTLRGAKRQTIIVSVLESLRCYLPRFTLQEVIAETQNWLDTGQSCFAKLLQKLSLTTSDSPLQALFPAPR